MRFLFLIRGDEEAERALPREQMQEIIDRHMAFSAGLRERGQYVLGEALAGSEGAFVVRPGDPVAVTDGPHAATKEALGGFYVVDCADRDEAVKLAALVPRSPGSFIEVLTTVEV